MSSRVACGQRTSFFLFLKGLNSKPSPPSLDCLARTVTAHRRTGAVLRGRQSEATRPLSCPPRAGSAPAIGATATRAADMVIGAMVAASLSLHWQPA